MPPLLGTVIGFPAMYWTGKRSAVGAPLSDYPIKMGGDPDEDPLLKRYPANDFVKESKIKTFFEELFGGEVF
jgi:hypothetical protein